MSDLERRLATLPPGARALALGTAVAGPGADPATIAAAAGFVGAASAASTATVIAGAVSELRAAGLHPLDIAAVYPLLPAGSRLGAHARAAAHLRAAGAGAAALAPHLEASARPGDAEAVATLHRAGLEAAVADPAIAARWHAAELRLLRDGDVPPPGQLDALLPHARALAACGRLAEARDGLSHALATFRWSGPDLGRLSTACAQIEILLGEPDSARQRLELAAARFDVPELRVALAELSAYTADFERFPGDARAALSAAAGDPALTAKANAILALALTHAGDAGHRAAFAPLDDDAPVDAFYYLGYARYFVDAPAAADELLARGLERARAAGDARFVVELLSGRALACLARADIATALELATDGLVAARRTGLAQPIAWSLWVRAWVLHEAGDALPAHAAATEAASIERTGSSRILIAAGSSVHAAILLEAGRPAEATDTLLRGCGGEALEHAGVSVRCAHWHLLAEAAVATGEPAAPWADRAARLADRVDLPGSTAHAACARALAESDPALAEPGVRAAEQAGLMLTAWRARLCAATSTEALRAVADAALAAGALRLARHAAAALTARGAPAPRIVAPPLPGLTARQSEVARLIAAGASNRAIAEQLGMSERTVHAHVTVIFERWDVRTRAAVAATAAGAA